MEVAVQRGTLGRIGLVVLNILLPGLANIRLGRLNIAVLLLAASPVIMIVTAVFGAVLPDATPTGFLIFLIFAMVTVVGTYALAIVTASKASFLKQRPLVWWQRWYSLVLAYFLTQLALFITVTMLHSLYKPFYIPASSMEPTLALGDRLLARMDTSFTPAVGQLILVTTAQGIYVKRVAAVAGDRIAMRSGRVFRNGEAATIRQAGRYSTAEEQGKIIYERFPGEAHEHRTLDLEQSWIDELPERVVPTKHLFLLGDNRDRSADSRVSRKDYGLEMVPLSDLRGRVLFRTFDAKYRWLGNYLE